jgi:hypothetical protein
VRLGGGRGVGGGTGDGARGKGGINRIPDMVRGPGEWEGGRG